MLAGGRGESRPHPKASYSAGMGQSTQHQKKALPWGTVELLDRLWSCKEQGLTLTQSCLGITQPEGSQLGWGSLNSSSFLHRPGAALPLSLLSENNNNDNQTPTLRDRCPNFKVIFFPPLSYGNAEQSSSDPG